MNLIQVVVSGRQSGLLELSLLLKKSGCILKALPLDVSAPFHSRFMKMAGEKLKDDLVNTNFTSPVIPVLSNVTGEPVSIFFNLSSILICVKDDSY
jgi:malonyl CoA-acyl carrier protein transacylase